MTIGWDREIEQDHQPGIQQARLHATEMAEFVLVKNAYIKY